jgi:hypothetical protein
VKFFTILLVRRRFRVVHSKNLVPARTRHWAFCDRERIPVPCSSAKNARETQGAFNPFLRRNLGIFQPREVAQDVGHKLASVWSGFEASQRILCASFCDAGNGLTLHNRRFVASLPPGCLPDQKRFLVQPLTADEGLVCLRPSI